MDWSASVDYLVVGHVTQDVLADGSFAPGGTASFAALTAQALGARAAIVTSHGPDAMLGPVSSLPMAVVPASASTVFVNTYDDEGRRQQRLLSVAESLGREALPVDLEAPGVVHLGPVADEIAPDIVEHRALRDARCVGVTPQGWMRRRRPDGSVERKPWMCRDAIAAVADALVFSEEDLGRDEAAIIELARAFPMTVVTRGARGARLFQSGREPVPIPIRPRRETDPTGAGDIFAAAFFLQLASGAEPRHAALTAAELAAESVERPGLAAIPRLGRLP